MTTILCRIRWVVLMLAPVYEVDVTTRNGVMTSEFKSREVAQSQKQCN